MASPLLGREAICRGHDQPPALTFAGRRFPRTGRPDRNPAAAGGEHTRAGASPMALLTKPSSAARTALVYITAGALIDVWTGIWLWWLSDHPASESTYFWAYGFLLTGLT